MTVNLNIVRPVSSYRCAGLLFPFILADLLLDLFCYTFQLTNLAYKLLPGAKGHKLIK